MLCSVNSHLLTPYLSPEIHLKKLFLHHFLLHKEQDNLVQKSLEVKSGSLYLFQIVMCGHSVVMVAMVVDQWPVPGPPPVHCLVMMTHLIVHYFLEVVVIVFVVAERTF